MAGRLMTSPEPMKAMHLGLIKPRIDTGNRGQRRRTANLLGTASRACSAQTVPGSRRTTGQSVECIARLLSGLIPDDNGVSSIVSSGTSTTEVGFGRQDVGELSFSFVTPLSSETVTVEQHSVTRCDDNLTLIPHMTVTP